MKKRHAIYPIIGAMMLFMVSSCTYMDQFRFDRLSTEVEFEPSIAAPLVYGSFSLQDVLSAIDSGGLVSQTEDSLLFIYYTDTAYSVQAGELIPMPDQIASEIYIESDVNIPAWVSLPEGESLTFTKTEMLDFEIQEGDQIDSVIFSNGSLNIDVVSEFQHAGTLTISSSQIFDVQGDTLNETFVISQTDGNYASNTNYDLSGYTMTFEEVNDSAFAAIHFLLELTKSSNPVNVGDECSISMAFEDLDFSKIFGFVAEREIINVQQSIDVDFYEAVADILTVEFQDPQLNFIVHNSYGIPLTIELQDVVATSSFNGTTTPMTFDSPDINPFSIDAPTVDRLGETVTSTNYFNYQNTNIEQIISEAPDQFDFRVIASTGETEPGGSQNFVLDTSKMVIEAEVVLPMWLRTDGYALTDTTEFEEALGLGDLSFVENANLRLFTTNQWPLELEVQAYFLDNSDQVLDSLFDNSLPLLSAAPVNNDGEIIVSQVTELLNEVNYTGDELLKLDEATKLVLKAKVVTTDLGTKFVKFYSHYMLSYRVDVAADFIINPREMDFSSDK